MPALGIGWHPKVKLSLYPRGTYSLRFKFSVLYCVLVNHGVYVCGRRVKATDQEGEGIVPMCLSPPFTPTNLSKSIFSLITSVKLFPQLLQLHVIFFSEISLVSNLYL